MMNMMSRDVVFSILVAFAWQIPMFLVWLAGLILAIARWSRHPRVSGFVLVAVFAAGGMTLATQIVFRVLPHIMDGGSFVRIYPLISAVSSLTHALAWACLLAAVFTDRDGTQGNLPPNSPFAQQTYK